jgi:hypothetical protein
MTAKLRTANIQGFKILQWRSLPRRSRSGYHTALAFTTSPKRRVRTGIAIATEAAKCLKTWPFRR